MTRSFHARRDILPEAQQRLWPHLRPASSLGLVLYGGTAIALRLGHRVSVDFDFFTDKPLDRNALLAALPFLATATVLQDRPNALTVLTALGGTDDQQVHVSFFGMIGFGRVGEPETTEDGVLQVASLDDLMATKAKVILQRVEAKDYRDIAAMIRADVSLGKGLAAARAMFGHSFQPSESLKAMTYFEGGDLHSLPEEDRNVLIAAASAVRDLPEVTPVSAVLAALNTDLNA
jgi:hypothetical protein